ncbi:MAG: hypothetical protein A2X12_11760 [Bacteroidetes bacterium GWE2_29_8]|nr:MAG: hypothetical protein A2X12_11760 [Bacteroidetes bacterium GWE2_29_8]OFY20334.1 MAG: hypothetical protein A2X02_01100 [Bacteroidetes bacterium GWF2_29_10]
MDFLCNDNGDYKLIKTIKYNKKDSLTKINKFFKIYKKNKLLVSIDSMSIKNKKHNVYFRRIKKYDFKFLSIQNDSLNFNKSKILGNKCENLNNYSNQIIEYYSDKGYPFTKITYDSIVVDSTNIKGSISISNDKKYKFDDIIIKGNFNTRKNFLYNTIMIKPGDVYNETKFLNIRKYLEKSSAFEMIKSPEILFTENEAFIFIYLNQKKSNYFYGLAGFQRKNEIENKYTITGEVKLNLFNSLKQAESINISWNSNINNTKSLIFETNYPFIFNSLFSLNYKFELFKKDTTYINDKSSFSVEYKLNSKNFLFLNFEKFNSNIILNKEFYSNNSNTGYSDVNYFYYGIGYMYNSLNSNINASKGLNINTEFFSGNKNNNIEQNKKIQFKYSLNINYFIPLNLRNIINTSFKLAAIENEKVFENELFRLGGINSLKGFDDESILASKYIIALLKYNFKIDRNTTIYSFFNNAFYYNQFKNIDDNPYGFGIGLELITKPGKISLVYALGKQFNNPIYIKNAKIHVGFTAEF